MTTNNSRSGLAVDLAATNRWLGEGETVKETDTGKVKIGPGRWNDLDYEASGGGASVTVGGNIGIESGDIADTTGAPFHLVDGLLANQVSTDTVPLTLAANGAIHLHVYALNNFASCQSFDVAGTVLMENLAGTQRLFLPIDSFTVTDAPSNVTPVVNASEWARTGTDLVRTADGIKSTAGGIFVAAFTLYTHSGIWPPF